MFDINSEKIRSRLIAENEHAFAFPSNMPIVPGHTLVVPKRKVSNMDELNSTEMNAIFQLQKKLKDAMIKAFCAEGFNFAWNEGMLAGQSVDHLHLHVLPRKKGDSGIMQYEPRKFLYRPGTRRIIPENELTDVAGLIRDNLPKT